MAPSERLTAFLLIAAAVCLTVAGEALLKTGMNRVGSFPLSAVLSALPRIAGQGVVWGGFALIGGGAVLWLCAIARAPLSWAYPLLSLGYVLVLVVARLFLGEAVPWIRWSGTLLILLGVWLVFRS